jgi:hypothetical protein
MTGYVGIGVCCILALGFTFSEPSSARPKQNGLEIGGRLAYGIPGGKGTEGDERTDLDRAIKYQLPLWVDIGYRSDSNLMVGAYFSYGFGGEAASLCDEADDCSIRDVRLGFQIQYHLQPRKAVDSWIGVGVGYEWLSLSQEVTSASQALKLSSTVHGFELFNISSGLDIAVSHHGAIGPFVSFALGQYDKRKTTCSGELCSEIEFTESSTINDKALHRWVFIGMRGTFVL